MQPPHQYHDEQKTRHQRGNMVSNTVSTLVGGMEANGVGSVQSPFASVPPDPFNFCIFRSNGPRWWHAPMDLTVSNNKRQSGHITIEWHTASPQVINLGILIIDSHLDSPLPARAIVRIHLPIFLIVPEAQTKSSICCCNNLLESPPAMGGRFRITTLRPVVQVKEFFPIFMIVHMLTSTPQFSHPRPTRLFSALQGDSGPRL
jgi:hypothetical protein